MGRRGGEAEYMLHGLSIPPVGGVGSISGDNGFSSRNRCVPKGVGTVRKGEPKYNSEAGENT